MDQDSAGGCGARAFSPFLRAQERQPRYVEGWRKVSARERAASRIPPDQHHTQADKLPRRKTRHLHQSVGDFIICSLPLRSPFGVWHDVDGDVCHNNSYAAISQTSHRSSRGEPKPVVLTSFLLKFPSLRQIRSLSELDGLH